MKPIEFAYLGEHPEYIPVVAQWHQDEWHHISPHLSTERRIIEYSSYRNHPDIPSCVIALIDSRPAGSASLVQSDMETHSHLTPWLASVYVHPDFRCQGVASKLIQHCLDNARSLKIKTLYLFTPGQKFFYEKRGWKPIKSCIYQNENVDIMSYDLS